MFQTSTLLAKNSAVSSFLSYVEHHFGKVYPPGAKNFFSEDEFLGWLEFLSAGEVDKQVCINYSLAVKDFLILSRGIVANALTAEFLSRSRAIAIQCCKNQGVDQAPVATPGGLAALTQNERRFFLLWVFSGLRFDSVQSIPQVSINQEEDCIRCSTNKFKNGKAVRPLIFLCNCYHTEKGTQVKDFCGVHCAGELNFPMKASSILSITAKMRLTRLSARRTLAIILRLALDDPRIPGITLEVINAHMGWTPKSRMLFRYTADIDHIRASMPIIPFQGFIARLAKACNEVGVKNWFNPCSQKIHPEAWSLSDQPITAQAPAYEGANTIEFHDSRVEVEKVADDEVVEASRLDKEAEDEIAATAIGIKLRSHTPAPIRGRPRGARGRGFHKLVSNTLANNKAVREKKSNPSHKPTTQEAGVNQAAALLDQMKIDADQAAAEEIEIVTSAKPFAQGGGLSLLEFKDSEKVKQRRSWR